MQIAIFSDIHANLTALEAVLSHCFKKYGSNIYIIHLGDCIDYGMRPNEVIKMLSSIKSQMLANIAGNHEMALYGIKVDYFSSKRGYKANCYTKSILTQDSYDFINNMQKSGYIFEIDNKKFLAIHGDLTEPHWGNMNNEEKKSTAYNQYDYVLSGHTHINSLSYSINKAEHKRTIFINPGSIGQPRNLNPKAQYAVLDTESNSIYFEAVYYDYKIEQSLYTDNVDLYYRDRLAKGI